MSKRKFKAEVSQEACKGCLICAHYCEDRGAGILKESEERTHMGGVHPRVEGDCIGCRWCERVCPDFAINVVEVEA